jgi:hypothetical protein
MIGRPYPVWGKYPRAQRFVCSSRVELLALPHWPMLKVHIQLGGHFAQNTAYYKIIDSIALGELHNICVF